MAAYDVDRFAFTDGGVTLEARWVAIDSLRSDSLPLFPVGLIGRL